MQTYLFANSLAAILNFWGRGKLGSRAKPSPSTLNQQCRINVLHYRLRRKTLCNMHLMYETSKFSVFLGTWSFQLMYKTLHWPTFTYVFDQDHAFTSKQLLFHWSFIVRSPETRLKDSISKVTLKRLKNSTRIKLLLSWKAVTKWNLLTGNAIDFLRCNSALLPEITLFCFPPVVIYEH